MKKTTLRMAVTALLAAATVSAAQAATYNQTVLADKPVMFLGMDTPSSGTQSDLSGNGHNGTYLGGTPALATLPNGDKAADFNGSSQYLTVPAAAALSVPTTKILTIESWIKPDTLQFPHSESEGYVYFLGKGNPTQGYEYANRMYSYTNTAGRPNRISDYDWNVSGGLGSGAYFQDTVYTTQWIHVVDVINMSTGYIDIWKNGVQRGHVPLSQYSVTPGTTQSPFNVGTRNNQSWFEGSVGKVAVYNYQLTGTQIANHYSAMTSPTSTPAPTAPAITGVASANVTQTGATINWTTDQASLSQVQYGLTTSYASTTPQSATAGTSHSVALSGLTAGTVYHYRVKSLNSSTGLTGVSGDYTFTTAAAATSGGTTGSTGGTTTVPAGCTQAAVNTWKNLSETSENGQYTLQFDATPSVANLDGLVGSSNGAATSYTSLATIVRFNNTGKIDARNGGAYAAASSIPYTAGKSYHFRLAVNVTAHTYSAYVTPAGGSELTIGSNYAFRSEQASVAALNNVSMNASAGAITVCNASVAASAPAATAPVISGVSASPTSTGATIAWTTDKVSHSQVKYGATSSYGVTTPQSTATGTSHSVALSGLTAGAVYHYQVLSLDSATGLTGSSADLTFTMPAAAPTPTTTTDVISNVKAGSITSSAANITWNTTLVSHSQVQYGLTTSYGSQSYQSTATGTSHWIPLSGLKSRTVYHYRAVSLDTAGHTVYSGDYTFKTL